MRIICIYLLLSILLPLFTVGQNKLIGTWKGSDLNGNDIYFIFEQTNKIRMVIEKDTIGGNNYVLDDVKRELYFEIDTIRKPYKIDIIILNSKNNKKINMVGIYNFHYDNEMVLCLNFVDNKRPINFKSSYNSDCILLRRHR